MGAEGVQQASSASLLDGKDIKYVQVRTNIYTENIGHVRAIVEGVVGSWLTGTGRKAVALSAKCAAQGPAAAEQRAVLLCLQCSMHSTRA